MPANLYLFPILAFDKDMVGGEHVRGEAWGGKGWRRHGRAAKRIGGQEPRGGEVYRTSLRFIVIFFYLIGLGMVQLGSPGLVFGSYCLMKNPKIQFEIKNYRC